MPSESEIVSTSKFLSLVLRHRPEVVGSSLDDNGWMEVDALIEGAAANGRTLTRELIDEVVATNDKRRFVTSDDGRRIRASQGHSLAAVDLGLSPTKPPDVLFHGTVERFVASIRRQGLQKRSRQHVHLSADRETATKVGSRRGKPVVLRIDAGGMTKVGAVFYRSDNGVWLTDHVPPKFIEFDED